MPLLTPFPQFMGWTDYSPVLPKMYYDVYTPEQQLKALMKEYDRLTHYLEVILKISSDNDNVLLEMINQLQEELTTVYDFTQKIYDEFENIYKEVDRNAMIYDPTQGEWVQSIIAQRNMYRELAVFGLREKQLENISVDRLSKFTVDEVSAVGNYIILGNRIPRATDPDTGLNYR